MVSLTEKTRPQLYAMARAAGLKGSKEVPLSKKTKAQLVAMLRRARSNQAETAQTASRMRSAKSTRPQLRSARSEKMRSAKSAMKSARTVKKRSPRKKSASAVARASSACVAKFIRSKGKNGPRSEYKLKSAGEGSKTCTYERKPKPVKSKRSPSKKSPSKKSSRK